MGEIVRRTLSKTSIKGILLENAALYNILPVVSTCNVRCKFCSHGQNPPGVKAFKMPPVPMELVDEALSLMDPRKPVVIGESVSRLMEGEPFLHSRIKEILALIREKMPHSRVKITTNGNLLDRATVKFLAGLGNVEICLSLNSADVSVRRFLMDDSRADIAVKSAVLLRENAVPYHGSIVAMPHLTGWDDLAGTIRFFHRHGAETVRVFMPGYTAAAPPQLRFPENFREQLVFFIGGLRNEVGVPVTLEPPLIVDLDARVTGVIAGSPACKAGIAPGDIIGRVNGKPVFSRVDAFKAVLSEKSPQVEISGRGGQKVITIIKERNQSSGLVMDFDIDPATLNGIIRAVKRRRAGEAVLITSCLGYPAIKMGMEKLGADTPPILPVAVKNRFFGGTIGCAG
ncbi:MAG: radical SAM protein, partial [Bacillota bacterium]